LVCHALVTFTRGSRFVGIDARHKDQLIDDLFLQFGQAIHIFANGIFIVC